MRPYEVMIILDPGLEEEAIRAELDRSTELIRSRGGTPGRVDRWGRRRLAYELQKHREGYYVLLEATAEPAVMTELDRALHLSDGVLRHKVVRVPAQLARRGSRPPRPDAARSEQRNGSSSASTPAPVVAEEATSSDESARPETARSEDAT